MESAETLNNAIGTGEVITIIYHGGSKPGSTREIIPLQINGNKVRARCYTSNAVKTFNIDKIQLCGDQETNIPTWDKVKKPQQQFYELIHALEDIQPKLVSFGWHVVPHGSEGGDSTAIMLHTCFKNGKPKKGEEISLSYNKFSHELEYDADKDTYVDISKERVRPYTLRGKNVISSTFGKIDRAINEFMTLAESNAPAIKK